MCEGGESKRKRGWGESSGIPEEGFQWLKWKNHWEDEGEGEKGKGDISRGAGEVTEVGVDEAMRAFKQREEDSKSELFGDQETLATASGRNEQSCLQHSLSGSGQASLESQLGSFLNSFNFLVRGHSVLPLRIDAKRNFWMVSVNIALAEGYTRCKAPHYNQCSHDLPISLGPASETSILVLCECYNPGKKPTKQLGLCRCRNSNLMSAVYVSAV